jgi:hypothetical protein
MAVRNVSTSFRIVLKRLYDLVAGVVELDRSTPSSASTRPLISFAPAVARAWAWLVFVEPHKGVHGRMCLAIAAGS